MYVYRKNLERWLKWHDSISHWNRLSVEHGFQIGILWGHWSISSKCVRYLLLSSLRGAIFVVNFLALYTYSILCMVDVAAKKIKSVLMSIINIPHVIYWHVHWFFCQIPTLGDCDFGTRKFVSYSVSCADCGTDAGGSYSKPQILF